MDALRSLKAALANARWLSRSDEALALVPDLVSEMPGLVPVQVHGSEVPVAPCAFSARLRGPLAGLLQARLASADAGQAAEAMRELHPGALAEDALVRVLSELLSESAVFGLGAQTLVVLELIRQSSGLLLGDDVMLRRSPNEAALRSALGTLDGVGPARRGEILGALAFSLQARLGAAYARTAGLARPGRVYQALAASRLPLVMRPDDLEFPRDLVLVARVLELPATQGTLEASWLAAKGSLEEGMAQDSGAGATLRSLAGEGASIQAQLLNPPVVGLSLSLLPALMSESALRKQGLSVAEARSLLGPGLVAASTSLLGVVNALRRLDLLAALSASVLPVERVGGLWRSEGNPVQAALLSLLSPCSLEEAAHGHVVGATLGMELAGGLSSHSLALPALGALRRFWTQMRARAVALRGRAVQGGPPFIAVFSAAPDAQTFEAELRAGLDNLKLDLGALGELSLIGQAQVASAEGPLAGGWSGDVVLVQGPPLETLFQAQGAVDSVWDERSMSRDEDSTGPIDDPFAPTPVSVEDDGPPDDWGSLSDLVGHTGELPDMVGDTAPEDLGEAVSYDLLGAFELVSRGDSEVDRLLEPYSQDIVPEGESVLSDSLDMELQGEMELGASLDESGDVGFSGSLDTSADLDLSGELHGGLDTGDMDLGDSLGFSTEPSDPFSLEKDAISIEQLSTDPPVISMPEPSVPSLDSEDEASFEVEIEDDEDSELDSFEPDELDLLGATDDLSVEESPLSEALSKAQSHGPDEDFDGDFVDDFAPEDTTPEGGDMPFYLPPPTEPSAPSVSGLELDFDDDQSLSLDEPEGQLSAGDALTGAALLSSDSLDEEWQDESPTYTPISEAPAFPDLGITLDEPYEEPSLLAEEPSVASEPSTPSTPAITRRDLDFLFQGYVVVRLTNETVFGRSYGSTLVDVHRYPTDHTRQAYLSFAKDKIRERFSPSSEDTWTLSSRDRADPLSLDQMMLAFTEAEGG